MRDECGSPVSPSASSTSAIVEVLVDHDAGTLSFRVNGGPPVPAQDGFGRQPLRPYASLGLAKGERPDRVSFMEAYRSAWSAEGMMPTAQPVAPLA